MIAGVCGGLARYLGTDPTLVRVVFALASLFFLGIGGVLAYLVLWAIVPEEPAGF
jgi:phage shock protein PspC (stress-responsive transcriptional regulator)